MDVPEQLSRRKLIKRGLALGVAAVAGDAFGIEPEWIEVERVEVPIRGLARSFDGYRIAMFSDVHWPRHIDRGYVHRVVALANAFDPNLIAIPGDLTDRIGNATPEEPPDMRGLFDDLFAPDGVYVTMGNHDHRFVQKTLIEQMRAQTRLQLVHNEHRMIRCGDDYFALGGVDDLWFGRVDPVATFTGVPDDVPRILLSHNPDVAEDVIWPTRIDLQLSGHTHGGEVKVPFGPAFAIPSKYGQKFRAGLVQGRSHRVYVTRGVCSFRGARFNCRPEVTYLTLRSA